MVHMTRFTPFRPAFQLRRDIDDLFGRFFGQMSGERAAAAEWPSWTPAVEGCEEDNQWLIKVALPGVDPKDIEIALVQGQLTIKDIGASNGPPCPALAGGLGHPASRCRLYAWV